MHDNKYDQVYSHSSNVPLSISSSSAAKWSAPAAGRCPVDVCQIHGSFSCVDPGIFGLSTAVLAIRSSFNKIRKVFKVLASAPSAAMRARQRRYLLVCRLSVRFVFAIAVRERVRTPLLGAARITWENWKDLSAMMSLRLFRCIFACSFLCFNSVLLKSP